MKTDEIRCALLLAWVALGSTAILPAARAESPYPAEWIRQLGTTADDESYGLSVDGSGNAYMTGCTYGALASPNAGHCDAFLTKYDSTGALQWARQLGTSNYDVGTGVSQDSAGNAYISGHTRGSLGGPNAGDTDAFLSKYDSSGTRQWTRQLGGLLNDASWSVSADSSGNAYLVGRTSNSLGGPNAGDSDAFLAKYDSLGSPQWTRQLGTPQADEAQRASVDKWGNLYITGFTRGSLGGPNAGDFDAFLSKYDCSGALQWTRQLGTPGKDYGHGVTTDSLGNVYITGFTTGSLGGPSAGQFDAFLAKYDGSGALRWTRQLGTSSDDQSGSVSVDSSGNVYMAVSSWGSLGGPNAGLCDAGLAKYDSWGTLLWIEQWGTSGGEGSRGVSLDAWGNTYVTGITSGSLAGPNVGGTDVFVAKFLVPEPGTVVLVVLGSLRLLWRRGRHHRQ